MRVGQSVRRVEFDCAAEINYGWVQIVLVIPGRASRVISESQLNTHIQTIHSSLGLQTSIDV